MSDKLRVFLRAQLSAFVGGISDFGIYTFCYKVLGFTAPFSNVVSHLGIQKNPWAVSSGSLLW